MQRSALEVVPEAPAVGGYFGIVPREFRLRAGCRPGVVRLRVADLERSLAFYCGVLGFRLVSRSEEVASLGCADDGDPLIQMVEHRGTVPSPGRGRLGLAHFAIVLPDRPALGRLLSHLTSIGTLVGGADHGVSEAIYLRDPDGLGLEISADRARAQWPRRGAELVMESSGLERQALIRAAAGERWHGIPAGTTIGHLHLHVGDIEEAIEFYHVGLGLDLTMWSQPGAVFLSVGGYHHHLAVDTWAGAGAQTSPEEEAGLVEWQIVVPGLRDALEAARSLASVGYRVEWGTDGWTVDDPWANRLRVRMRGAGRNG